MESLRDSSNDFELIRYMANREADPAAVRYAWAHFYCRHHSFLLRVVTSRHLYLLGGERVKELVQDAFMKAFDGAATFKHSEICEPETQERKCRRWLVSIALNLVRDSFRGQPEIVLTDELQVERLADEAEIKRLGGKADRSSDETGARESKRLRLVRSGLALLSDTEQTVLRATMEWWQPDQKQQRMPHEALSKLSRLLSKSPDNVRQIRLRAMKKIQDHVSDNLKNEEAD